MIWRVHPCYQSFERHRAVLKEGNRCKIGNRLMSYHVCQEFKLTDRSWYKYVCHRFYTRRQTSEYCCSYESAQKSLSKAEGYTLNMFEDPFLTKWFRSDTLFSSVAQCDVVKSFWRRIPTRMFGVDRFDIRRISPFRTGLRWFASAELWSRFRGTDCNFERCSGWSRGDSAPWRDVNDCGRRKRARFHLQHLEYLKHK